jgi:Ca2+-binding EF-hand superfamily protein
MFAMEATMTVNNVSTNTLTNMLDRAFIKFDQNSDGKLNSEEFASFNEILKPGTATDANGKPLVDYHQRIDTDNDGDISQGEMHNAGVLMPADLTSDSFSSMIKYLTLKGDPEALAAAAILED